MKKTFVACAIILSASIAGAATKAQRHAASVAKREAHAAGVAERRAIVAAATQAKALVQSGKTVSVVCVGTTCTVTTN